MDVEYLHFDEITSTHLWVKEHSHELDRKALICVSAGKQTAGIGRFKRPWLSCEGNLYATLFFTLPLQAAYLSNIGQILAYSCTTYLRSQGFDVMIKWPNDLLIHKKKVAGILTDIISFKDQVGVILSIGLNISMSKEDLSKVNQPATSLERESNKKLTPQDVLYPLVESFLVHLTLLQQQGFSVFQAFFEKYLAYKGEEITLKIKGDSLKGVCQGITQDGRLKFLLPQGDLLLLWNGNE